LIPFKAKQRKSRLSKVLTSAERSKISELMLLDVIQALRGAALLPICYVVTSDRSALALSRKACARTIQEQGDSGVSRAVAVGMSALSAVEDFVVIPSDLPMLSSAEVRYAIGLKKSFECVLAPSRSFDGTNLLAFSRLKAPPLSYDSDSFWNHIRGIARKGMSLAVCCGEGIASDVDTPTDLMLLAGSGSKRASAEFAREVLARRPS